MVWSSHKSESGRPSEPEREDSSTAKAQPDITTPTPKYGIGTNYHTDLCTPHSRPTTVSLHSPWLATRNSGANGERIAHASAEFPEHEGNQHTSPPRQRRRGPQRVRPSSVLTNERQTFKENSAEIADETHSSGRGQSK